MEYTIADKLKIALIYKKEISAAARVLFTSMPYSYLGAYANIIEYITNKEITNAFELDENYLDIGDNYQICCFIKTTLETSENITNELIDKLKTQKIQSFTKKRIRQLKTIIKKHMLNNFMLYTKLYDRKKQYTFEELREAYKNNDNKTLLKQQFLKYIRYTDIDKKKQSKRYSISRDLDKDIYYETTEGRLAKIKGYLFKKYMKKGKIDKYYKAYDVLPEGVFVKPMRLINKTIPKANESMKLLIASLFEGIKECHMIIDTDFETAYNPYYNNHQDTDGDKASNYSCMSGEGTRAQDFYGKIHGCKVVRWETDDGEQVGRCIMYEWKDRRHFIRIYGRYDYHRTMINMLEAQMKEKDLFGRNKAIEDIKLETDMDYETNTMYLDGNRYGIREEGGNFYMVTDKYDCDCKTTGGDTLESLIEDSSTCEHCGGRVSNDDGIWIDDYFYCDAECAEADGWRCCERCGEWERTDDCVWIEGTGYYCCEECARSAGYEYDNYNNEWVDSGDLGVTDDGKYNTTKCGAADYYGVDEDKVEWDCNNYCWKRPEQEQTEEGEENGIQE